MMPDGAVFLLQNDVGRPVSFSRRSQDRPQGHRRIVDAADDAAGASEQTRSRHIDTETAKETRDDSQGDILLNRVTGEILRFLATSADTHGEYTLVECVVAPDGFVAAAHVHPFQTETFTTVEGAVGLTAGREKITATPGDTIKIEPGTAHKFWNAGDTDAIFRCEIRPALQFERLIETMFRLAQDDKTNRKGMPNPLRLAVIADAHFGDVRLPSPPAWTQRAALALGAPVGRLFGFKATYDGAATEDVALAV